MIIKKALALFGCFQVIVNLQESIERRQVYDEARAYADNTGKPLLVIGTPKFGHFHHPCGDVTVDINPEMAKYCNTEIADIRSIPYPDRYFGAAFVSHVLEHLSTIADAYEALDELHRVADRIFIVSPHKTSFIAWIHPEHHLWVRADGDDFIIEQRGRKPAKMASYMVAITATS